MFSKGYFTHVGQFKMDTILGNHGCASYALDGNKMEREIIYRFNGKDQGQKKKFLVDVRNDKLTLRWLVDENWELAEKHNIETYVRLN